MTDMAEASSAEFSNIVSKLVQLDCTLLGNSEDWWLKELLLKPGFHRYQLLEWIFEKLGYSFPEGTAPQNSEEEKVENLLTASFELGFNKKKNYKLIKGTANENHQLKFWKMLLDILWRKSQIQSQVSMSTKSCELKDEAYFSQENVPEVSKIILEEYDKQSTCISRLCESVNLNNLFSSDINLFPPHALKESEQFCASLGPEELKRRLAKARPTYSQSLINQRSDSKGYNHIDYMEDPKMFAEKNDLETTLDQCLSKYINVEKSFSCAYDKLKHSLHVVKEDFVDVGPEFKEVTSDVDAISLFDKAINSLESTHLKIEEVSRNFGDFQVAETLPDDFQNLVEELKAPES